MPFDQRPAILIAEDDAGHLANIQLLLEDHYEVYCAANGAEAIDLALQMPELDAILMDIKMPEMGGYEACEILKDHPETMHIPVILMTGQPDQNTIAHAFEVGAADYVQKPLNPVELQARLRVHCHNRQLTRHLRITNAKLTEAVSRLHQRQAEDWQRVANELRLSQQQLHSVIANLPVILFVIDSNGVFTLSEGHGLQALGLAPGQVVGQSALEMYADYPDIISALQSALDGQALRLRHTMMGLILEVHYAPLTLPNDQNGVIGLAVNITDQVQAELQQKVLFDISRATSNAPNTAVLLDIVRDRLGMLINTQNFFVALYEPNQNLYSFPFWADENDTPMMERRPLHGSLTDYVRRTGKPVMIRRADRERLRREGEITQVGTASRLWVGAPLKTADGIIGVMAVQSYEDANAYTEQDLNILSYVADNIAWVIDSKRKQDALKLSEERFSKAFFASPISVTLSTANGKMIDANSGFERMFGYTREEAINHPNFTQALYVDLNARQHVLEQIEKHGHIHDYALELRHKGGFHLHCILSIEQITIDGQPVLLSNVRDVTQQFQLVSRLTTLNEIGQAIAREESPQAIAEAVVGHLSLLFRYPYISIVEIDSETQRLNVLAWSLPQPPLTGVPVESVEQVRIDRLMEREIYQKPFLQAGDDLTPSEQHLVDLDVQSYIVFPLAVEQEFIGGFVLARHESGAIPYEIRKIGEEIATLLSVALHQARLHEQIRSYAQTLETQVEERTRELTLKAQELEAFTYSVSHDLRAPLRAMNGFADVIIEDFGNQLPEEAHFYLGRIRYNAQHMSQLIDDLLTLSRVGRHLIVKRRIKPGTMIADIVERLRLDGQLGNAQIEIEELPECEADPALLRQVWVNLITNAIKYTSEQAQPQIHIGADTNQDGFTYYRITDNGIGFDMAHVDQLFVPFQRLHADDEYEGSGIGLATVARIIERHGGDIQAEGERGKGATFYFRV